VATFYRFALFFKVVGRRILMITCWTGEGQLSVTKDGYLLQVTHRRCSSGQEPLVKSGCKFKKGKFDISHLQLSIPLSDILDITVSLTVHVSQFQLLLSCLVIPLYWRHFMALSFNYIRGMAYLYVVRNGIIR
jgi:hypothetical protein